jgi:hypothetical protein
METGRVRRLRKADHSIILIDVSSMLFGDEFKETLRMAGSMIRSEPEGSVLTLFDATDAHYSSDSLSLLKEFAAANKPYVKASAVVGMTGLKKIALQAVATFSGRVFKVHSTREKAIKWLSEQ